MSDPNWTLEINGDHLVIRVRRQLTLQETVDAITQTNGRAAANRRLWVLTQCMRYSTPELRAIARNASDLTWPEGSRTALVAADDFSFGMCRMYGVFRDQPSNRHRAFRTEEEALEWLRSPTADPE